MSHASSFKINQTTALPVNTNLNLDLHAQQILSSQSKTHYNQSEELCPEMDTFIFVLDENLTDDDTVLAIAIRKHFCHF
ncbi:unnamed protein product [Rotaria sordida]|uniref:Uncharacterized protein n=1 Tax=Rotaria sordida TaxID=392033 RepID=A0A814PBA1_9BILA|nr:unnamed protein product [Rotaria sordida]